jgi:DNA-binding MarR family transcriptional regulator
VLKIHTTLHYLQNRFQSLIFKKAEKFGLRPPQIVVLMELNRSGTLSLGELSKKIELSKGTASKIVDSLVKMGIVSREIIQNNRRKVKISLLHSYRRGKELRNEILSSIIGETNIDELKNILVSLEKLKNIINKIE